MAEEKNTPTAPVKRAKKTAMPEAPPEPKEAKKLPTPPQVRAAKKAELVAWAQEFGLDSEGKVDELRKRILDHLEKAEKPPEVPKKEEPEEAAKPAKPTKAAKVPKKPAEEEAKKGEEGVEEYEPKQKPKLDAATRKLLVLRAAKSAARPSFRRQEWFRYKRFHEEWRKPQGGQSKLRRHFGYRWNLPSIGYRGPREVRGLHPSGFQEVLIHNPRQLEGLDPAKQAVRIAGAVGARKRVLIEKACEEKGLRVLNRMVGE